MAQKTQFNSNNTQNGWIYNEIINRMNKIENDMTTLMTILERANSELNISLDDFNTIVNSLSIKTDKELFDKHAKDNEKHIDPTSRNLWNNKLDVREIRCFELVKDENDEIKGVKIVMKDGFIFPEIPVK